MPPEDSRDALIREQAERIETQAERIAALEAVVADLREQLAAAERAGSRNSGNSLSAYSLCCRMAYGLM